MFLIKISKYKYISSMVPDTDHPMVNWLWDGGYTMRMRNKFILWEKIDKRDSK